MPPEVQRRPASGFQPMRVTLGAALLGIVMGTGVMLLEGDPVRSLEMAGLMMIFIAFIIAPFLFVIMRARQDAASWWPAAIRAGATCVVVLLTAWAYYGFATRTQFDAQDGMIFPVLAVYQFITFVVVEAAIGLMRRFLR